MAAVEPLANGHYAIRQLGRLPLGMRFPEQAQIILRAVNALIQHGSVMVVMDATGVGGPVVDILTAPLRQLCMFKPVEFAAGDTFAPIIKATGDRYWRCGKAYLVSRLKALLQNGRIDGDAAALGPEFDALKAEVLAYEIHAVRQHDFYGAHTGAHDDLVTALALSCLDEEPGDIQTLVDMNKALQTPRELSPLTGEQPKSVVARQGPSVMGWKF